MLEDTYHPRTAPVYALDWCRRSAVGSRGRPGVRKATGSLTGHFRKQIAILGLRKERILVLVEDHADRDAGAGAEARHARRGHAQLRHYVCSVAASQVELWRMDEQADAAGCGSARKHSDEDTGNRPTYSTQPNISHLNNWDVGHSGRI
jgi:hypothetical protein